jgi:protein arginine N-methyltransferase 1
VTYNLLEYGGMVADRIRMSAYEAALRAVITPNSVVLDIGTGIGVTAMIASRLGARRVYAIEPDASILVARTLAAENQLADRVEFIQALSTAVSLPEPADVIVSDLRGVLPLLNGHIPAIVDARERHLAPGGKLVPERDEIWGCVVDAPELYQDFSRAWSDRPFGVDLGGARKWITNHWVKVYAKPDHLLAPASRVGVLDYGSIRDTAFRGELRLTPSRPGTAHGIIAWFDAILAGDIGFSNAPTAPRAFYGQAFFPFPTPVAVEPTFEVVVELNANLVGNDYVWAWNTVVRDPASAAAPIQ